MFFYIKRPTKSTSAIVSITLKSITITEEVDDNNNARFELRLNGDAGESVIVGVDSDTANQPNDLINTMGGIWTDIEGGAQNIEIEGTDT